MRRLSVLWSTVAILLMAVLAFSLEASAQDATPGANEPIELLPGVTMDSVVMADDGSGPASFRLHLERGAPELVIVETGTLIVRVNGSTIVRTIDATTPASETSAANTDLSLRAGQFFVLPSAVVGELRNEGEEPVTILVAEVPTAITATPVVATPAG
jgi:hypothetical protein